MNNEQSQLVLPKRFKDNVKSKKIPVNELDLLREKLKDVTELKNSITSQINQGNPQSPQLIVLFANNKEIAIEAGSLEAALENTQELLKAIIDAKMNSQNNNTNPQVNEEHQE